MTSDVRRDGLPRSNQCGGGDVAEPTAPALDRSAVSRSKSELSLSSCRWTCDRRVMNSCSVSSCRSPNSRGRSKGTLSSASLVHVPCRSGSPHGVRGAEGACPETENVLSTHNAPIDTRSVVFMCEPSTLAELFHIDFALSRGSSCRRRKKGVKFPASCARPRNGGPRGGHRSWDRGRSRTGTLSFLHRPVRARRTPGPAVRAHPGRSPCGTR